jgi:hypothetical protein
MRIASVCHDLLAHTRTLKNRRKIQLRKRRGVKGVWDIIGSVELKTIHKKIKKLVGKGFGMFVRESESKIKTKEEEKFKNIV